MMEVLHFNGIYYCNLIFTIFFRVCIYVSAVDDGKGYLLLTSGFNILKLGSEIMDTPKLIYNTPGNNTITGLYYI